jgi:hypothetical protein
LDLGDKSQRDLSGPQGGPTKLGRLSEPEQIFQRLMTESLPNAVEMPQNYSSF